MMGIAGDDLIGWHEWPTNQREAIQEPRTDLAPIHEPEPGLLDEEILPLWDDWMRGTKLTYDTLSQSVKGFCDDQ